MRCNLILSIGGESLRCLALCHSEEKTAVHHIPSGVPEPTVTSAKSNFPRPLDIEFNFFS